jgi:glycosyltransferase involved in cell wall biosynthesis
MAVRVSVVMPVYNGLRVSPRYLPEAIESVLSQTVPDFELIVVDDGSDEDYGLLKARYADARLRWLRLQRNRGMAAARNAGAGEAKADLIAFIDADDRWYPERLQYGLESHKDCIMTYSDFDEIDPDGSILTNRVLATHQPGRHPIQSVSHYLERNLIVLPSACMIGRQAFLKAGGFDEQLRVYEDNDLFLRLLGAGRIVFIDRPLLQYRVYPESYSKSSERTDRSRAIYFRKLARMFPDEPSEGRYWLRDKIAPMFAGLWFLRIRYTIRSALPGAYRLARHELRYVSSYGPFRLRLGGALFSRLPYRIGQVLFKIPRFKYVMGRLFLLRHRRKSSKIGPGAPFMP